MLECIVDCMKCGLRPRWVQITDIGDVFPLQSMPIIDTDGVTKDVIYKELKKEFLNPHYLMDLTGTWSYDIDLNYYRYMDDRFTIFLRDIGTMIKVEYYDNLP